MTRLNAETSRRPWHRWIVGPLLILQGLVEGSNIVAALVMGGNAVEASAGLPVGALDYYAALTPWDHLAGAAYVLLLIATGGAVMAWVSWGRITMALRGITHVAYFGWHLSTSAYLAVFGWTGFAISTALLAATLLYIFALTPRAGGRANGASLVS